MKCLCCQKELVEGEHSICLECLLAFPLVDSADEHNPLWEKLVGKLRFEHATHLGYYQPGDPFSRLIAQAKYDDRPQQNALLANLLCDRLEGSGWPHDVDVIVPVPVHWRRLLRRGYNQVTPIVRTLGQRWNLPVVSNCLMRAHFTTSQVGMTALERQSHQKSAFRLWRGDRLRGKHILLVDDVCTTGSTLVSCAEVLQQVEGVRISLLTLAITFRI